MNLNLLKKDKPEEEVESFMYTEDQLMARLKFFIGVCLTLTLTGIVFVVLYSIIFVTQPLNAMSPIDQKFFEMLIPISTFLTGILSGIMLADKGDKEARMKALDAATRPTPVSPNPSQTPTQPMRPGFSPPSFTPSPFPTQTMPPNAPLGMPPMPGTTTMSAAVKGPLPPPPGVTNAPPPPPPVGSGRPPLPPGAVDTSGQ